MATNTEELLSGSTSGKPILISTTATPGTLIHTAVTGTASEDNVWIYACNNHTAVVTLTIEYGGTTAAEQIIMGIPAKEGLILVIPGLPLNGGLVIRAFASVTNVVSITGLVNRRTD